LLSNATLHRYTKVAALPFRVGHGFDLHRLELLSEMPDLR
jgi:hypothetical protein